MADKKEKAPATSGNKTSRRRNSVWVEGYLKENTLEAVTFKGVNYIRGNLVISVDEFSSFKIRFFVPDKRKEKEVEAYKELISILPDKTISIAGFLDQNPKANFETAAAMSTKVYATASFDEYVTKSMGKETSYVTLEGNKGGLKTLGHDFEPRATFNCDMYIESLKRETIQETETGRLEVVGLIPHYTGRLSRVKFYTAKDATDYVEEHYSATQTANFSGNIIAVKKESVRNHVSAGSWGSAAESRPLVSFTAQRIITGGHKAPIDQDAEGAITAEEVKEGLTLRATEAIANSEKRGGNKSSGAAPAAEGGKKDFFAEEEISTPQKQFNFSDF